MKIWGKHFMSSSFQVNGQSHEVLKICIVCMCIHLYKEFNHFYLSVTCLWTNEELLLTVWTRAQRAPLRSRKKWLHDHATPGVSYAAKPSLHAHIPILHLHCKKRLAGISLTKLSLAGNNLIFPARESLVSNIPPGDGKIANLFYTVLHYCIL